MYDAHRHQYFVSGDVWNRLAEKIILIFELWVPKLVLTVSRLWVLQFDFADQAWTGNLLSFSSVFKTWSVFCSVITALHQLLSIIHPFESFGIFAGGYQIVLSYVCSRLGILRFESFPRTTDGEYTLKRPFCAFVWTISHHGFTC